VTQAGLLDRADACRNRLRNCARRRHENQCDES
jgi:hypothetical protein